jgi:hypothetical protein
MTKHSNKDQLLIDIQTQHRRLEKTLASLSEEAMLQPGAVGSWSVKDVLAHLTAWEQLFLDWYNCGLKGDELVISPVGMSRAAMDALNQQIYANNQARPLDGILAEFHASYQQILTLIETIPEADMFTPGRFAWTGKLTLADYIAGNTCSHYAWANSKIRKWARDQFSS